MNLVNLMRESVSHNRGRMLTVDQLTTLLQGMGQMAADRQAAILSAQGAEAVADAYVNQYGDELLKELVDQVIEGEIIEDDQAEGGEVIDEETEETGLDGEEPRVDTPPEEEVEGPVPEIVQTSDDV